MATKKQKREAALAKRAAFEAEVKADGLKALARAKEHEAQVMAAYDQEIEKINRRHREILAKEAERNLAAIGDDEQRRADAFAKGIYLGGL